MKHYRAEKNCLNCGEEVEKNYCSNCGQENLELKEPFWHFIGHSISHYFHFDSKFFHTLKPLLTEPGRLTLEYLAGRRMTFLHPVSMYIFVSIVYFLVVPPLSQSDEENEEKPARTEKVTKEPADIRAKMAGEEVRSVTNDSSLVGMTLRNAELQLRAKEFEALPFGTQQTYLDSLRKSDARKTESGQDLIRRLERVHQTEEDSTYEAYLNRQSRLPADQRDNWIARALKKREIAIEQRTNENWDIQKEVKKYNPKLYFLLMPLFAFFLMLNFRRNKKFYIEHLIFTIHFFTAFFIFQILVTPIDHFLFRNDSNLFDLAEFMIILWYIYTALKVFYQRKKWTLIRKIFTLSMLLLVAYGICYGIIYSVVYMIA
ncbi:MAG TPA: DUF3667 domain-containing protein [Sphingobacteriaceae bacterium]